MRNQLKHSLLSQAPGPFPASLLRAPGVMLDPQPLNQPSLPGFRARVRLSQRGKSAGVTGRGVLPTHPKKPVQPLLPKVGLAGQAAPQHLIHISPGTSRRDSDPIAGAVFQAAADGDGVNGLHARTQAGSVRGFPPIGENDVGHLRERQTG